MNADERRLGEEGKFSDEAKARTHLDTATERGSVTRSSFAKSDAQNGINRFDNPNLAAAHRAALHWSGIQMRPKKPCLHLR